MMAQLKRAVKALPVLARPIRWTLRKWRTLKSLNPRLIGLQQEVKRLRREVQSTRLPNRIYSELLSALENQGHLRKKGFEPYSPWLEQARLLGKPAADLGCQAGDCLLSLKAAGLYAVGVEYNAHLALRARNRGLSVFRGDTVDWLDKQPANCLGLITASELLDHLPIGQVWRILSLSRRVLANGGLLIIESLNADSPQAQALRALDPGFKTVLPLPLLKILLQTAGFELLQEMQPAEHVNALVARKPGPLPNTPTTPANQKADGQHDGPEGFQGEAEPLQMRDLGPWSMVGPTSGSYSLAIINRNLLASLGATGQSTLEQPAETGPQPLIELRNDFPPRLNAGSSPITVLANYAWEETGYPAQWVDQINQNLQAVTACSPLVKKILRDAGVCIPIAVVGNGLMPQQAPAQPHKAPLTGTFDTFGTFRFLHISTGLRRKGVDLLIQAFDALELTGIELLIKTSPNPTNELPRLLQERSATGSARDSGKRITVIEDDLSDQEMADLIASSHVLVLPSRAEGFGLPIAEAALLGIPSIVPDWGGHRCFANAENAWLVRSPLTAAKSHLNQLGIDGLTLEDSVWCEPDVKDLCQKMQQAYETPATTRLAMASKLSHIIQQQYAWPRVAKRTVHAIGLLLNRPPQDSGAQLAWVSTFNSRCGIATYSENLIDALPTNFFKMVRIYANTGVEVIDSQREKKVARCWDPEHFDAEALGRQLTQEGSKAVVIQHNAALFPTTGLSALVNTLSQKGLPCFVDLHNTQSLIRDWASRPDITTNLAKVRRIFVHSIGDLNNLAQLGLGANVCLLPHGVYPEPAPSDLTQARRTIEQSFQKRHSILLSCFGFALPHKGFRNLINAVEHMRASGMDIGLMMLCAEHPHASSRKELQAMEALILKHQLSESVWLRTDFIAQSQAIALLAQSDLTVYPYDPSEESASGAVRMAIAAGRPILCSPIQIFEDLGSIVHTMTSNAAEDIVDAVTALTQDPKSLEQLSDQTNHYRRSHQWPVIAKRLAHIMQGDLTDPFPDDLLKV